MRCEREVLPLARAVAGLRHQDRRRSPRKRTGRTPAPHSTYAIFVCEFFLCKSLCVWYICINRHINGNRPGFETQPDWNSALILRMTRYDDWSLYIVIFVCEYGHFTGHCCAGSVPALRGLCRVTVCQDGKRVPRARDARLKTERQRGRGSKRHRGREAERERGRERQRERERERERESHWRASQT